MKLKSIFMRLILICNNIIIKKLKFKIFSGSIILLQLEGITDCKNSCCCLSASRQCCLLRCLWRSQTLSANWLKIPQPKSSFTPGVVPGKTSFDAHLGQI